MIKTAHPDDRSTGGNARILHHPRWLTRAAHACLRAATTELDEHLEPLREAEQQRFRLRLERWFQNVYDGMLPLYGKRSDFTDIIARLVARMARCYVERADELKALDAARELEPDWFQHESMLGYACYVERFAGSLDQVHRHLDYLDELGVNYLHLMKIMQPRQGENDGGYAIIDYGRVDPRIGSNDDLETLCRALRERNISACIDMVLNHCAREHPWAEAARRGDTHYQNYFYMFDDRTLPDAFERTLPEVFPEFAPGNFTFDSQSGKWVWTTFNDFQWDLNWSNPEVFLEIVSVMFSLANLGVEVLRLDAVAFLWKRLGTNSQNQEEVFDILMALRSCARIATPAVAHKAEAIVSPDDLIRYFGVGRHHGKVSNIAYHNSLMVQFWSALASRDTRLMTRALSDFPRTPNSISWGTYVRCHDDIGWAIADDDAAAAGLGGHAHRQFLSDFYSGSFPGSFGCGGVFQYNPDTGDRRINGTLASLTGLEQALLAGDQSLVDLAVMRILLGHTLICGFGGLPLIYMGDEIGLLNDYAYANDPQHAADSRWLHRPLMDWDKAAQRTIPNSIEARLFGGLQALVQARCNSPQLSTRYDTDIVDTGHPRVFVTANRHPIGNMLSVYNFTEDVQYLRIDTLLEHGLAGLHDRLSGTDIALTEGHIPLGHYASLWLVAGP